MASSVLSPVKRQVDYPSSDGEPVAESDVHISCLLHTREDLKLYFGDRPDVYVAGNLLIYYEENNVKARVAPGRVRGDGRGEPRPVVIPAVGGRQGAGLRAGDHLAGYAEGRPGGEARAVSPPGGDGVLAVRPEGRVVGAAVTGHGAGRRGVPGVARAGAGGRDAGDDEHGAGAGTPQRSERVALPRSGDRAEHPDAGGDGSGVGAGRATP